MTKLQELCYVLGIKRMPEKVAQFFSRRFLLLDFLSGGRLFKELYNINRCLGQACNNHDKIWLPDHPELMVTLRRGKTEAEVHDSLEKNLNDAKSILFKNIYMM